MTLIANHAAINARVIGANEHESHYIFDLLMSNTSDIIPDVLSTDTHGVNHVNFALLDLFGYQFAPSMTCLMSRKTKNTEFSCA
ncbi:transposase [Klebsiella pneumoniae]|nr:transposase [Klebsiella pneumoniae]